MAESVPAAEVADKSKANTRRRCVQVYLVAVWMLI